MSDPVCVLHVDDDPDFLEIAARQLERAEPDLVVATETDTEVALDRLATGEFDCVLSDYEMPGTDGLAFLEAVREAYRDLPFVLFTANGSEEVASAAIAAGVTDYVRKETGTAQFAVLANRIENTVRGNRSERERREFVERVRTVFERITDGFFALDADWRLTYLNSRAAEFFEGEGEEFLGTNVWDAFPGSVDTACYDEFHRAMETQRPVTVREYHESLDAWFDSRAYPSPEGLSVFIRDVTDRERLRREIAEIEVRLEALNSVTADLHTCQTAEAVAERIVNAAERVLDFDICYVCLRAGDQLVPVAESTTPTEHDLRPLPLDHGVMGETYRTGRSVLVADAATDPLADPVHGDYRSAVSVPIGDEGVFQAVAGHPSGFSESDLELAESLVDHATEAIARVRSEERLRAERDRLGALFENVPEPTVAFELRDGDPIAREVNSAFEETFGYDASEIVGQNVDEYIVPVERDEEASRLNERLQAGDPVQVESRRGIGDSERDFLLQVVPLVLGERNVEGYAIYTDITDQKARERDLERQNDRLEEFAGVVSHDLRNPLSVAQGRLELAREACGDGADEHFVAVETAHDRIESLAADVLALARQGRTVGETRPVDLAMAVADAWESVETDAASLVVDGDLGSVPADPGRLGQLLENLFRNAVQHGGPAVTVRVSPAPGGFAVADDGPGIPTDRREQVFEMGYTDATDGTGFGLAIVETIASAHGWTVEVDEGEARGARFVVGTGD